MELLTPRTATVAIQEAIRRERNQEQYVDPLIGRSVEPRGQLGRERKTSGVLETNTIVMLSRARVVTTAAMNATERLRIRAFQARANGEYDGAITFYKRLSTARPYEIEAKFHLAVCLERTGQFAQALAAYKQVQKLSGGQHALAYYNMGNLCMRADRIPQAIDYFSRAIAATKDKDAPCNASNTEITQSSGSGIGPAPIVFYRQRAAAYRKNGDFEKAAQDYVLVQRCVDTAPPAALAEENTMFSAEHLYQTVKRAASPTKLTPQEIIDDEEDEVPKELDIEECCHNQKDTNGPEEDEEKVEDAVTAWTIQRCLAIARLSPYERSESDLQYFIDFMQKRFSVCATLHPDVCKLLCRELEISPEGSLPPRTPIFMEQDEDTEATRHDRALYFILQGRVSVSKTSGRMFQPSPQRLERQEENLETKDGPEDDKIYEQEETWESPWSTSKSLVSAEWKKSQLELVELEHGDVFGHQGRFTDEPRPYSAVTTTTCVIGALSWHQWQRIEQAQHETERERAARFLTMTSAFSGISSTEIRNLALRATFIKVVGSKAVCCEGQSVDGLLVIREGELCQFTPGGLRSPPDMSVSFALSGSLSEPQSARAFFTQLETAGDPLSFLRVNEAFHGFLPQNYVARKQRELLRLALARKKTSRVRRTSVLINCMGTGRGSSTSEPVATALRRGECFCISSSWVPPRQSRQDKQLSRGIACAKATLVSVATAELIFLSSADLVQGLSAESRSQLHRNLQDIALTDSKRKYKTDLTQISRYSGPPVGKRSSNLLEQFVRDTHWSKFKEELVENVLRGRT
ncbi:hypothetical protein PR001_g9302 [Phytophthora rubi]|uniref:Cyclic nucleotide-binding domain-containing protein n=2 Tax=Phytophthora rubi TaxID=129364 RepID=A0A6A3LQK3_9STRA|nr:hypothetical protein PR002_g12132 [Phytophthora rubi]KAE9035441.1 hypothetical protein PR001_g9302 [Phytophthora rubi]